MKTLARLTPLLRASAVSAVAAAAVVVAHATPIQVTTHLTGDDLVHVIAGSTITIVGNATLTGSPDSAGTFTSGLSTGMGIDAGIVLTSGNATLITNQNTSNSITGDFQGPGDPLLSTLAAYPTFDATVLAFDFRTSTGNLFFNFVFASDEYNEWANTAYNDTFAFTVDGENIALLPHTTTPISIDTVNGGNPLGTDAHHPEYFHNNDPATGGTYPFEYDGFTTVFTVSKSGLDTTLTHSMRLAIADGSDYILDSAVFVQAGSFDEIEHPHDTVPEVGSTALLAGISLLVMSVLGRRMRRTV